MNSSSYLRLSMVIFFCISLTTAWATPENDNHYSAIRINTLPYTNQQITEGATKQSRELTIPCMTEAESSVWYTYIPKNDEMLMVDTFGSDYDTALSVWVGEPLSKLKIEVCNDDSANLSQSQVIFTAKSGIMYWINVSGYRGETGHLVLHMQAAQAMTNDTLLNATEIIPDENLNFISQPINSQAATLELNETNSSCAINSSASIWYTYIPKENQQVVFDTFLSNYDTVLTVWAGKNQHPLLETACNDDSNGGQSQLALSLSQGREYFISIIGKATPLSSDSGVAILRMTTPPSNDDIAQALKITALPYENQQNTGGVTVDSISPSCSPKNAGVWYQFTPEKDYANVTFSTVKSSYDTVLSVWTGNENPTTEIACNDDVVTTEEQSRASQVSLPLSASTTYFINISSAYEETGHLSFKVIESKVDFFIATQPLDQNISLGQTATLSVVLNDSKDKLIIDPMGDLWGYATASPFTFQWYQGNVSEITTPIGTNSPIFTTPPLDRSTRYWVSVTNPTGRINSIAAAVMVGNTPLPPDIPVEIPHNGVGIDINYQEIPTTANFTGLVTKSLEQPVALSTITQQDDVFIIGEITVDPQHIGQTADILVVGIYQTDSSVGVYMRNDVVWKEWHNWNVAQLTAAQTSIILTDKIEVPIFTGNFAQMHGNYDVYIGYRLKSNANLIYSSESIQFTVN